LIEIVDSHAHLDMREFDEDRDAVIRRALDGGVKALLSPIELTDPLSLPLVLKLLGDYPGISAAAGIHPHRAKDLRPEHLEVIKELARSGKIAAIGEIGIDHHYDFSPASDQADAFRVQLSLAQQLALPVIIHSRNAAEDVVAAVEDTGFTQGGVLHCFTEDRGMAERMIDLGFLISFSGILTYRNASGLRDVAASLPLDSLLVETDSPFLVPHALRDKQKRNEPLYVMETAKVLAEIKWVPLEELAAVTTDNYRRLISKRNAPS
jgi:TatD DNase family protein